ncbi:unnamed protein product [Rhizoctonia solani]|uniref:FMR1-interacting protein 1 conserved domain-containing protein n=1 Tax=Rhizoctonia solani TaxID=456999 RepID=A0A8H3HDM6_9AGAM|nr:unnamed protein product [Rhizoctonia solani]
MSWNTGFGSSRGNGPPSGYYQSQIQPHYANAYYYGQQGTAMTQSTTITVPPPGFSRHQPMASLVPSHMRNRTGPVKCGHEGCLFAGTHKEVEVHKMDRHLIFPPGWQEKVKGKRKRDGDDDGYVDEEAQFRTSGAASILGTDVKLDSPEAIAAWLEERKKRWPSAQRIVEKAQRRREALERGQILAEPSRPHRSGTDSTRGRVTQSQRGRGCSRGKPANQIQIEASERECQLPPNARGRSTHARGRGGRSSGAVGSRGRGRGRPPATGSRLVNPKESKAETNTTSGTDSSTSTESSSGSGSDSASDDGSGSDMDPLKDAVSSKTGPSIGADAEIQPSETNETASVQPSEEVSSANARTMKPTLRRSAPQPPKPAYNPFNHRPNLLRNLLMPDIQATVSNLSQAIKFLVANDFLENVELKPGDAENVPIQPMDVDTQQ